MLPRQSRLPLLVACVLVLTLAHANGARAATGLITRGVVGYGSVQVTNAGAPANCTSPAHNPGGTEADVNAGTKFDCAAFNGQPIHTCVPGAGQNLTCRVTLVAQAPPGWRFDHWSGTGCAGTNATCGDVTFRTICNAQNVCSDNPFDSNPVAHFVDTRPPTATLDVAPVGGTAVYSASQRQQFTFHSDELDERPTFECKRDAADFTACPTGFTWNQIPDGVHDFCVRARDASGLIGSSACVRWEQELDPAAQILTHPQDVAGPDAAFTYSSNKAGRTDGSVLTYLCALDGAAPAACGADGKAFSALAEGQHSFTLSVVFKGALEFVTHQSQPARFTWVVDLTAPETTIIDGPREGLMTSDQNPTLTFTASEAGSTFKCSLDGVAFTDCTPPTTVHVAAGPHSFQVLATDRVGNTDPTPAVRRWTVVLDGDRDGFPVAIDCDDANPAIHPGAVDAPADGIDQDCNGTDAARPAILDGDGDGFPVAIDCDDANPAIHPGAVDAPADGIDQDCNGTDTARPAIGATVTAAWKFFRTYMRLTTITVANVPARATIQISCKGPKKACPFKTKRIAIATDSKSMSLTKLFKKSRFTRGCQLSIAVTKTGTIGSQTRYVIQKLGRLPKKSVTPLAQR